MGLQDKLTQQGSPLSKNNGGLNQKLAGSNPQSKLHGAANGEAGYSLDGSNFGEVNGDYQEYSDGVANTLPAPSNLDTNGVKPSSALTAPGATSLNNTFQNGTYRDNLPDGAQTF